MELKNQKVEGDLQIALKTIKELQRNHDKNEGKINKNENKAELEAIVQYLSLIILSKPDAQSSKNEETICNLKNICGENFFKIMEELYLKINDYEFEADALKEKIKEQVKLKIVLLAYIFVLFSNL